mmetsp:Transcript_22673/g.26034  ORF Transcript_22673/g.26034 Transcript_22673/m.26034 type:complete len:89 (-) Transcript_22673:73-339(-)
MKGATTICIIKFSKRRKEEMVINKYNRIIEFLDAERIVQLDFHGLILETKLGKDKPNFSQKSHMSSENQITSKPSSLFMRRKMQKISP